MATPKREKTPDKSAKKPLAKKPRPDLSFEYEHARARRACIGVDEVGRGCLAGPVVTAAVILPQWLCELSADPHSHPSSKLTGEELAALVPQNAEDSPWWLELNDSKLLKPQVRERLAAVIQKYARVEIAWCSVEEIDRWNILRAAMRAMRRAVGRLASELPVLLVDGQISPCETRYFCEGPGGDQDWVDAGHRFAAVETLVKGDQRSMSIAAASIVAKVYRDRWMTDYHAQYPGYGFSDNKGYGAPVHYEGLRRLGPCVLHRRSFSPVLEEEQKRLAFADAK